MFQFLFVVTQRKQFNILIQLEFQFLFVVTRASNFWCQYYLSFSFFSLLHLFPLSGFGIGAMFQFLFVVTSISFTNSVTNFSFQFLFVVTFVIVCCIADSGDGFSFFSLLPLMLSFPINRLILFQFLFVVTLYKHNSAPKVVSFSFFSLLLL